MWGVYFDTKISSIEHIMNNNETQGLSNDMSMSEPRVYEVGYHVMPTVNEGDLSNERNALVARITKFNEIGKAGGRERGVW